MATSKTGAFFLVLGLGGGLWSGVTLPTLAQNLPPASQPSQRQWLEQARQQIADRQLAAARTSLERAIAELRMTGDRRSLAVAHNLLGTVLQALEQLPEAAQSYAQSLEVLMNAGIDASRDRAVVHDNLARALTQLGRISEAIAQFQQALGIYRNQNNVNEVVAVLNSLGRLYLTAEQLPQASDAFQQALALAPDNSAVLLNLGTSLRRQGQNEAALKIYERARALSRRANDLSTTASILNNIAAIYRSQGKYSQALDFYQQSLTLLQQIQSRDREAVTRSNIGAVYDVIGQSDRALSFHLEAARILRELGDRRYLSIVLSNVGLSNDNLRRYDEALKFYNQALPIHRELGDRVSEANTLNNIAAVYRNLRRPADAEPAYRQALAIVAEVGNRSSEAAIAGNLARLLQDRRQFPEALVLYQRALSIHRQLGERPSEGLQLANIADLLADQKQTELAILFYKQSVNLREAIRADLRALPVAEQQKFVGTVESTYRTLADLLIAQDRLLEAQQVLDLLKVEELQNYFQQVRATETSRQGVALLPPEDRFFQEFLGIQNRAVRAGEELIPLQRIPEERRTPEQRRRINDLLTLRSQAWEQLGSLIESPAVRAIVRQLGVTTRTGGGLPTEATPLQRSLRAFPQRTAMLYPLISEDHLDLVVLFADGAPLHRRLPVSRVQLNRAIAQFREDVRDPSSLDVLQPAQQLYGWLVQPIAKDLAARRIDTILYAPDGQLRYLPLAALHDGQQWLVQQYRVNNITASSLTTFRPTARPAPRILAAAFTTGTFDFTVDREQFRFSGLPFAAKEVQSLVSRIPQSFTLLDREFTLKNTTAQFPRVNIIHLATHAAFVAGNPENSFVVFGDGSRANLRDIATWSLRGVELIVLSACETGLGGRLGNGTEVLGFGYQMETAGARAAIASLWQVSDGGTQIFMDALYDQLRDRTRSQEQSLALAQRALIQQPKSGELLLSHPYYWAPFILIGNGL
ncbi:MAG: tetratricopeptide repeat protein [Oscillatoriales cyanobacterium SM2_2_1]|nr:tetratricopeptide repeat protein [Oscillatoriales cyanobacterium SM2_2_1]